MRRVLFCILVLLAAAPRALADDLPHFRVTGYLQTDGVLFTQDSVDQLDPSTGEPLNRERVLVRRARLRGDFDRGPVSGSLELDGNTVNGADTRLISAEVSYRWPSGPHQQPIVMGTLGMFKMPFGREVPSLTQGRLFMETTTGARALFPGDYDLGLRVRGGWRWFRYSVAAVNGQPAGDRFQPARDANSDKDLMGRVGVEIDAGSGVRVKTGVSGLTGVGLHPGLEATKDTLVWRDLNEDGRVQSPELMIIPGQPAEPSEPFDRFALGGDFEVSIPLPRVGRLVLAGELTWAENLDRAVLPADPVTRGRDLREFAWYLSLEQEVFSWGLVGVRYDVYDPDADATDQQGTMTVPVDVSYSTLAVAVAWRWGRDGRLTLEYDHEANALGRDQTGAPATLASDRLTLRAQVSF